MLAQIIRDPASPREEVYKYFFYESLRIAFLKYVLARQQMRQGCQVFTVKPAQLLLKTTSKLVQCLLREVKYTFLFARFPW